MIYDKEKLYSHGIWQIKKNMEKNFFNLYREFIEFAKKNFGLLEAELFGDFFNNSIFVSYGLWQKIEDVKVWTESIEFKDYMSKFSVICKSIKINIIKPMIKI